MHGHVRTRFVREVGLTATSGSPAAVKSGSSMAAPHVTGVVAGWLESQTAPGTLSTWPTLAWQHVKRTATCGAVTYFDASRTYLTPNRLFTRARTCPCRVRRRP